MTTALIKKMKNLGFDRHYLKSLVEHSKAMFIEKGLERQTTEAKDIYNTSGVNIEKLTKYLCETIGDHQTPVKLRVYPLMSPQLCYGNSSAFALAFNLNVCMGVNITACECGEGMSFELHAVCVDEKGTFYDTTEDMFGEKEKWFLPIHTIENADLETLTYRITLMKGDTTGIAYSARKHMCVGGFYEHPHSEQDIPTIKSNVAKQFARYKQFASCIMIEKK
jgi:hypothetical protein